MLACCDAEFFMRSSSSFLIFAFCCSNRSSCASVVIEQVGSDTNLLREYVTWINFKF
jgi:hypothetical protein